MQQDLQNPYGHNEIVIDPQSVVDGLPGSVLAFFVLNASSPAQQNRTRAAHALFHRDWPTLKPAGKVPLLVYSPPASVTSHVNEEQGELLKPFGFALPLAI